MYLMPLYCIPTPDIDGADHIGVFHTNFYRLDVGDETGRDHTWIINAESAQDALQRMECVITPDTMEDERAADFLLSLSRETRKVWLPADYNERFLVAAARMAGFRHMRIAAIDMREIPEIEKASFMVARPVALGAVVCKFTASIRHFFADARTKGISPILAGQENASYRLHLKRHADYVDAELRRRESSSVAPPIPAVTLH
jgi:hypothetical protein